MAIKYMHTNIIAKDWRKLADFYIEVFNCEEIPPERDLSGEWLERLTTIDDVQIRGIHLRLPGYVSGPTLEIFSYEPAFEEMNPIAINQYGFAHIAFHVDDVEGTLDKIIEHGGSTVGEVSIKVIHGLGKITVIYARDIEGNIVEVQNVEKQ